MLLRYAHDPASFTSERTKYSVADELEKEFGKNLYKEAALGSVIKALPWKKIVTWVGTVAAGMAAEEAVEWLVKKLRSRQEEPTEPTKEEEPAPDIEVTLEREDVPVAEEPPEDVKDSARQIIAMIVEGYDRAKEEGPEEFARFARDKWPELKELVLGEKTFEEDPIEKEIPAEEVPMGPSSEEAAQMEKMLSPEASEPIPFSASGR